MLTVQQVSCLAGLDSIILVQTNHNIFSCLVKSNPVTLDTSHHTTLILGLWLLLCSLTLHIVPQSLAALSPLTTSSSWNIAVEWFNHPVYCYLMLSMMTQFGMTIKAHIHRIVISHSSDWNEQNKAPKSRVQPWLHYTREWLEIVT